MAVPWLSWLPAAARWAWSKIRGRPTVQADRGAVAAGRDQTIPGAVVTGDQAGPVIVAQPGATVNVYYDGLPQAKAAVRDPFEEGERLQGADQHEAAIAQFENAFAAAEDDSQRCALHIFVGNSLFHLSRLAEAEGRYREALHAAQRVNDSHGQAAALGGLGNVYAVRGDPRNAEAHYRMGLEIDTRIENRPGQATALGNLGNVYAEAGDLDKAEGYYKQALQMDRDIDNPLGQAKHLVNLGNIYAERGRPSDFRKAEKYLSQGLALYTNLESPRGQLAALGNLGSLYARRGQHGKARLTINKALDIARQIRDRLIEAQNLGNLGLLHRDTGDPDEALRYLREAHRIFAEVGASPELEKAGKLIARIEAATPPKPKRKRSRKTRPPKP
jgi:tetratricopeptide (TPR) repeat protein